jgi:hypothetical protein
MVGEAPEFDIFLSYRVRSDSDHVEKLYNALTAKGFKVWWDKMCLKPGVPWEEGFCEGLIKSYAFVPVMSKGCNASMADLDEHSPCDNVLLEYRLALELRHLGLMTFLHPVMVGDKTCEGGVITYGNFFRNGCYPRTKETHVRGVEDKVREHMDREGLGVPLSPNMTIHTTLAKITENQGVFIEGEKEATFAHAVDKIADMCRAHTGENREPDDVTPLFAHEWEVEMASQDLNVQLKEELVALRNQLASLQSRGLTALKIGGLDFRLPSK